MLGNNRHAGWQLTVVTDVVYNLLKASSKARGIFK